MATNAVTPLTMWDLQFLSDVADTIRDYETTYAGTPDPNYDFGKTLGPKTIDADYVRAFDKGKVSKLAYLQDLIKSMPDLTTHTSYTEPKALEKLGSTSAYLQAGTYDGIWVALLSEYIAVSCPAVYQRTVEYLSQASPAVYGDMQVMIDVRFDLKTRLLKGNLYYHHLLNGPLPYFDDLIGSLYITDETNPTYTMADFLMKWGEIQHNNRPGPWRLDQSIIIDPYMTQFAVFYETEASKAVNNVGQLSSALWLNNISLKYGKVHSPLTMPFEDWFVIFNMVPHSDVASVILPRIPTELKMAPITVKEYKWYMPGDTPWIP